MYGYGYIYTIARVYLRMGDAIRTTHIGGWYFFRVKMGISKGNGGTPVHHSFFSFEIFHKSSSYWGTYIHENPQYSSGIPNGEMTNANPTWKPQTTEHHHFE